MVNVTPLSAGTMNGFVIGSGPFLNAGTIANGGTIAQQSTVSAATWNGGTMQGTVTANGLVMTGSVSLPGVVNAGSITGLPTPSAASDAATKGYVDASVQGLQVKPTAALATAAALSANTYVNGAAGVGATLTGATSGALVIDGQTVVTGQIVLVKNEATASNNGLYTVTAPGAAGQAYVLTRQTDMEVAGEFSGAFVPVGNLGTANANTLWLANPSTPVTVGSTPIPFTQLNAPGGGSFTIENGGSVIGSATTINAGANMSATVSGGVATFTAIGTVAPSSQILTVPFPMIGTVAAGQEMNITFTQAGTLLANGGAFQSFVGTNPAATEHLTLNTTHSGTVTTQGTVSISTAGSVTAPTFAAVPIAAGDTAQLLNQATADTTFANACVSFQFQLASGSTSQLRTVAFPIVGTLAGGQTMNVTLTQAGTLLANGGAFASYVGTNPTATETLTLNTINSGTVTTRSTISVSTAGSVTPPTFAAVPLPAGGTVQLVNQATADATFGNACLSLQFQVT